MSARPSSVALVGSSLLLATCAGADSSAARQPRAASTSKPPAHIVVIVMENKEYDSIIGSSDAPYMNELARQNVLLTKAYAV